MMLKVIIVLNDVNSERARSVIHRVKIRQIILGLSVSVFEIGTILYLRRKEKPLGHWITEEDELD